MTPEEKPVRFARAMNAGDLEGMLSHYEEDATFVPPGGLPAHGRTAVRAAMTRFLAAGPAMEISVRSVTRAGDVALVVGDWTMTMTTPDNRRVHLRGRSTEVQRRGADGSWRCPIDDPAGTAGVEVVEQRSGGA